MKIITDKNIEIDLENVKILVSKLVEENEILLMTKSEQFSDPGLVWMPYLIESSFEDRDVVPIIEEKQGYAKKIAESFIVNSEEMKTILKEILSELAIVYNENNKDGK